MLFVRLIWCALLTAVIVGSLQFGMQQWKAVPIIRAAEVFEAQKAEGGGSQAPAHASEPGHEHGQATGTSDDDIPYRGAWTWVANVLYGFSMALLMFAVMGWWVWRRGDAVPISRLALAVAAAGLLSLDLWPALGLPAEIPGMDAAALGGRQAWWLLAAVSAALACALLAGIATKKLARRWRWLAASLLLAVPFIVGAPQAVGDPLAGFSVQARAQLQELQSEFVVTTRWISLVFWVSLGCIGGWTFRRWINSTISPAREPQVGYSR